ncbi:unnamed protein product [Fusarium venenatum]|uniref:Uncharacterized protein n=1 Tax=Fusarium venenatum TaxID=56646 RepID=A0A2L2TFX1_9HYPO|nr:uncharacterized protein FVRRES_09065 [Fusarium venenatum]CEI68988.1 unnamed protein product [Fusarium venenatum]
MYVAVTKQKKSHRTKEDRSRDEALRRWQQQAPAHNIRGSRCRCSVKIALQSPPACPVLTGTLAGLNATLSDL